MTSNISLRRTGITVFASRIASVFTGLIFLVMMTRTLSSSQFGLWEVIIDLVAFASYPAGLLAFWATRDVARGRLLGRTAIELNLLLSAGGVALYLVFSEFTAGRVGGSLTTLLLALLLVPLAYWGQATNAVISGHRPVAMGYVVIVSEAAKLAAAFPLLIVYRVGIDGVILAVMVANFSQAAASTYLVRDASALPVDLSRGRTWLAHSWLPGLTTLPYVLSIGDTFVASVAASGTRITGYYQAAFAIATIAGYSIYLAPALYPLLLKGGSEELPTMTLELLLLFGTPMAFGAAALATPLLYLLKSQYTDGATALMILAFAALANTFSYVLDQTLMGGEKVDAQEDATFRHYLKSNLVYVSVMNITASVAYLILVFVIVSSGAAGSVPLPTTLDLWAVSQLAVIGGFAIVKLRRVRRRGRLRGTRPMASYLAGSIVMAGGLYGASRLMVYGVGTAYFATELAVVSLFGMAIYFGILYAAEESFRGLVRSALASLD